MVGMGPVPYRQAGQPDQVADALPHPGVFDMGDFDGRKKRVQGNPADRLFPGAAAGGQLREGHEMHQAQAAKGFNGLVHRGFLLAAKN